MQLSQRIRARDLEEFFSAVGKVRDVRLITCNKTRRFKGIAYIEFRDPESVALVGLFYFSSIRRMNTLFIMFKQPIYLLKDADVIFHQLKELTLKL